MIILGLGSNLGDRESHLREALRRLAPLLSGLRASRVLESEALLPEGAPADWNRPYLNMAACGQSPLSPAELLAAVKAIESAMGRRPRGHWGPREIDIDILAMGDKVITTPALTVPHRELLNRPFALLPLAELTPDWYYPVAGQYHGLTAAELVARKHFTLNDTLRDSGLALHG